LRELAKAGITWSVVSSQKESTRRPGVMREAALVSLVDTKTNERIERHYFVDTIWSEPPLERFLIPMMRDHWPQHPLLKAWFDSKGNYPVELESADVLESLGYLIHMA